MANVKEMVRKGKVEKVNPIVEMIGAFPAREKNPVFKASKNLTVLYPGAKGKEYTVKQVEYLLWKYAIVKNLDATPEGWDKNTFYANKQWKQATGTEKVLFTAIPRLVSRMLSK